MANVADAPKDSFRLSMLLYDTRYRSLTIQVFVFFLFMAGAAWLVDNTMRNLEALGKDFDFGFLWNRAGYDISQRLVDYTNDSTHGRAMLVGLLNTLLIALLGCMAATVIGVLVGVLRLSRNWIVGRLMTVYVEVFRNVPLLLWILLIYAVFSEATPAPNAFRPNPETGIADRSMFLDAIAVTNRYTALPNPVFSRELGWLDLGLFYVNMDVLAVIGAIIAGWFINRSVKARATRIQEATGERPATWWSSLLLLVGLPVAVLLALGFHLEFPELRGFNFVGGLNVSNSFMALWLALSLYTGAFIAEIVRGHPRRLARPVRGGLCARPAAGADDEPRDPAAGAPGHHPAAHLAISEPHEELLAGHRRGLSRPPRHAGRHHAEPDRARARMRAADDADLSCHQPRHFGVMNVYNSAVKLKER